MRVRSSLVALCMIAAGTVCFAQAKAEPEPEASSAPRPVRFAVIGDRTGTHQPGVHGAILEEVERMKPDFVIGVGDMIEGYSSDTTAIKAEWKDYRRLLETLSMPFYPTPGNHDIWDSTSQDLYARIMGERYHSFDIAGIHFIILDTGRWLEPERFEAEQFEWLKADLQANREATATIVFAHAPKWYETVAIGRPGQLHEVLKEYGVDAVFDGHYHTYFSGEYDGVRYTAIGSSGGECDPGITGLEYHFAWVTVNGDEIDIAPIRLGSVLPWDEVTAQTLHWIDDIRSNAVQIDKISLGTGVDLPETRFQIVVKNMLEDAVLRADVEWEIPDGWRVSPRKLPLQIVAAGSHAEHFTARSSGPLYPVPVLSMDYPYDGGKTVRIEKPLPLERAVYAERAKETPVIDGTLSEEMWGEPTTLLFGPTGSAMPTDSVFFYFSWDEGSLYLGAECVETRMDSIAATAVNHDDAVYGEDCVGYFLQPEVPDGPVYQIYFNPLGTAFDQKIAVEGDAYSSVDRGWNGTYETATARGPESWTIEVRIPLEDLGTRGEYEKVWKINFRRKQRRLQTSADWQVPISYNPGDYGILVMR